MRTALLTVAALIGFAGNSLLCRAALGMRSIDAASFTSVRLLSGALTLSLIVHATRVPTDARRSGSWRGAFALFAYAIAFSFAYLRLQAGVGALVLFGVVQMTMVGAGVRSGNRLRVAEWLGLALAFCGLIALTLPGLRAPDPLGTALMALAGVAWSIYSLLGRTKAHALAATADNFARSVPLAALASLIAISGMQLSATGVALAVGSGAITSGIGYTLWYAALPALSATRAAIVQLSVPVLAAFGGVLLLDEPFTWRLGFSGAAILGGVALALRIGRKP